VSPAEGSQPERRIEATRAQAEFCERCSCLVCGSSDPRSLLSLAFDQPTMRSFLQSYYSGRVDPLVLSSGRYHLLQCRECRFIWQSQILSPDWMAILYQRWVDPDESRQRKERESLSLSAGHARQIEAVARLVRKSPKEISVLDFGMGWGLWCRMAKAFGFEVWGVDIATDRIAFVRQYGVRGVGGLDDLDDARTFDFINLDQVLEHVPDPKALLERLVSRLRAGGGMRIGVPNVRPLERQLSRGTWVPRKSAVQPLEHVNCFSASTLHRLARDCGLHRLWGPPTRAFGGSMKSHARTLLGGLYRQHFGTTVYFVRGD